MEYQLQYNYCAIIIYLIIIVSHLLKKRTKEIHNKVFTMIVIVSLIGAIVNIFNTMGNMNSDMMPHTLLVLLDYIYFIALNLSPFIYAIYAITLTKNSISSISIRTKLMIWIPFLIIIFMIVSNPFLNMIFKYTNGIYQRGEYQIIMYVVDMYYTAFGVVYVLSEKESTTREVKIALLLFLILGLIMALIQYLQPELLVQHMGLSICELIVLISLQKPEEFLVGELGTYNRHAFERIFRMNINSKENMQILMINIEDLNFLIQTVGVDIEKEMLREIAEYLNRISRGNLYTISSDTFFIVNESNDENEINQIINKINERFKGKWGNFEEKIFVNYKMMKVYSPKDVKDLDVLYFCEANFINKISDKNNMVNIKDIDFNKVGRRLKVESIIKRAIAEDNFSMYYQPIYSFKEKKVVSAEALIRLNDPDEGFIPPDEFIPIAEKNGTILKIGEIVFEKVFEFIRDNDIEKLGIKYIEINLSLIQCMQQELASRILGLLNKYGIDKKMINLEITETAVVDSPKILLKNMNDLFEAGISFSLDDFGTGYSNINSLMSMPLDIIKFDKSLVDMASNEEKAKEVIDSSVEMVKKMGMEIVAEGIEEKNQIYMLKDMGVDYLQGYYFSRPLPQIDFLEYIKNHSYSY